MSSRKRPLSELRQPTSTAPNTRSRSLTNTPTRYTPSTPHAIRALQQRSAGKTRSIRTKRFNHVADTVRPDSARGILRRLAKITAPATKVRRSSDVLDKENVRPEDNNDGEEDDDEQALKKPHMTLDIDESLEDIDAGEVPTGYEEDEDSELPAAPTPSVLPDDDRDMGEQSVTFKSIDFARQPQPMGGSEKIGRRKSRLSFTPVPGKGGDEDEDEDPTVLTERGRRAVSEEMTGRLSRYSFGSIRMSDFGEELEIRRESDPRFRQMTEQARSQMGRKSMVLDEGLLLEGETEDLSRLRNSIPQSPGEGDEDGPLLGDDNDFQLFLPEEDGGERVAELGPEEERSEDVAGEAGRQLLNGELPLALSPQVSRRLTELETAALEATTSKRKKRMKMTRHGTLVPSLPSSLIRRIATETQVRNGRRRPKLGKDHMKALEQATEWFFEQVGEDLAAYANHGRRKKRIDTSDALMLMRRQRVLRSDGEVQRLAKDFLPREVLAELDLPENA